MTANDILRRARARYASAPSHLALGEGVIPEGQYCAYTALWQGEDIEFSDDPANPTEDELAAEKAARVLIIAAGGDETSLIIHTLAHWNATHTTEEVLAGFDRAIKATA